MLAASAMPGLVERWRVVKLLDVVHLTKNAGRQKPDWIRLQEAKGAEEKNAFSDPGGSALGQ
jgi:hypothetical protein